MQSLGDPAGDFVIRLVVTRAIPPARKQRPRSRSGIRRRDGNRRSPAWDVADTFAEAGGQQTNQEMSEAERLFAIDFLNTGRVANLIPQSQEQRRHQAEFVQLIDNRGILL
ncbi:hypothetical protein D9M68_937210 [compost metagenome]